MHSIGWTPSAIATVWQALRKHPHLARGFRRRPLAKVIEQVIHDE